MTGPAAQRCGECGGPLDASGFHASEYADCDIARQDQEDEADGERLEQCHGAECANEGRFPFFMPAKNLVYLCADCYYRGWADKEKIAP